MFKINKTNRRLIMKNFHDLFIHELSDIYSAELQIDNALPELIKKAHSKELKEALHKHHLETKKQIKRLDEIADELNVNLEGKKCDAIENILREGHKFLQAHFPHEISDAAIISSAQRVEHYEISVYGTLKSFAKHLELKNPEKLLNETFEEEKNADKTLNNIAYGTLFSKGINKEAARKTA